MRNDSLKNRYLFKLSTNLLGFLINIATAGIVPRALGVKNYGNFNFTTTILNQIFSFLDLKSTVCFYTKLSQRQNEKDLLVFYTYYTLAILTILTIIVSVISFTPLKQIIFTDIGIPFIYYALIYVILYWILGFLIQIMDATGLTILLERRRIFNKVISTLLILGLYFYDKLSITVYFYFLYVTTLLLIISIFIIVRRNIGHSVKLYPFPKKTLTISYLKEFYTYSKPLAFFVLFGFLGISFDRLMLQFYGGSFEQGLFAFAYALSNFCFIFITAIIPLFTRELSIAANEENKIKMAKTFRQYVPLLYVITAYFCSFIFVERESMIQLFGGSEYIDATNVLGIMAFYPLVSTYSNLNGSVIYATGKTKILLNQSLFFLPVGMLLTYILLSNEKFGLDLGAVGLASKNVIIEFFSINVILYINSRYLNIGYWKYFAHMVLSILPFIVLAYIAHFLNYYVLHLLDLSLNTFLTFLLSGIFYTLFTFIFLVIFPLIAGLHRKDINKIIHIKFKL